MDVQYFLKQRIAFIRQFYKNAAMPFLEIKRKIEAKEPPFHSPPYSEDGEPPYLEEWLEADESLHVLGAACLSMLAASLHLYLRMLELRVGAPVDAELKRVFKKQGWFVGYREYFARYCRIPFEKCPADLALLEELVLARNRVQHPDSIVFQRPEYSEADLAKLRRPFFIDETESLGLVGTNEEEQRWLMPPMLHVTAAKLETALAELEHFAEWLESGKPAEE